MRIVWSLITFLSLVGQASEFRDHKAHRHGDGSLSLAFDGGVGEIEFRAASMGVLGFEHEAKSVKDRQILADVMAQFEKNIGQMIKLEPGITCKFSRDKIGIENEISKSSKDLKKTSSVHSDFVAIFKILCDHSPVGARLTIDFTSIRGLQRIQVTILAGNVQKSAEYKGQPLSLVLR